MRRRDARRAPGVDPRAWPQGLTLALALLLGACDSPTIPARTLAYDFTLATEPALVFHWPTGSTVRVHASELPGREGMLGAALAHGMSVWNQAVLYEEYRLVRAASAAEADAVLVWADQTEGPVITDECRPSVGRAVTTFCAEAGEELRFLKPFPLRAGGTAESPVRFVVSVAPGEAADAAMLRRLVAHELGHVLGILRHAPSGDDLMTGGLLMTDTPSAADRQTVQILYHTVPDLRP